MLSSDNTEPNGRDSGSTSCLLISYCVGRITKVDRRENQYVTEGLVLVMH